MTEPFVDDSAIPSHGQLVLGMVGTFSGLSLPFVTEGYLFLVYVT